MNDSAFGHRMQKKSWELSPEEQEKENRKSFWVLIGIIGLMVAIAIFFFMMRNSLR